MDAVIFPGRFLRLNRCIGRLSYDDRVKALNSTGFVEPIKSAVTALNRSPGALIVVGVDGPEMDQLCVAVDKDGIAGIGRKVFPTEGEAHALLCYDGDFGEPRRVVQLPSGRKAILAACYDMFGVADRGDVNRKRAKLIRRIGAYQDPVERGAGCFQKRLNINLEAFRGSADS